MGALFTKACIGFKNEGSQSQIMARRLKIETDLFEMNVMLRNMRTASTFSIKIASTTITKSTIGCFRGKLFHTWQYNYRSTLRKLIDSKLNYAVIFNKKNC